MAGDDGRWVHGVGRRARGALGRGATLLRSSGGLVWRFARALAIGVAALYVVYVIAANAALRTAALPDYLDDVEEEVRIDYATAWTAWPGTIHVTDLLVATQDSSIQHETRAEAAEGEIAILPLFDRKVVFSNIRASGVSVRIRGRRDEAEAIADAKRLPPMATWGALALKDPKSLPKDDPDSLWHIILDDTAGSVKEVWVENVRITGDIRARGTFDFAPLKKVIIDQVRGTMDGVAIEVMGDETGPFVADIDGAYRFTVLDFDVPSNDLVDIVRFADIDADLTGQLYGDRLAEAIGSKVRIEDGSGAFLVRGSARQGRMLRGSHVVYESAHLGAVTEAVTGKARDAVLDVLATSDEDMVTSFGADTVDLHLVPAPKSLIHVQEPSVAVRGRMVPHFMKPTFEGGEASIPAANMGLAGLDGIAEGVRFRKGIAFARAKVEVDRDGKATGEGHSRVEDLDAVVMGVSIKGRSTSTMHLDEAKLAGDPSLRVRTFLTLDGVDMKVGDERVDDWWARLEVGSQFQRTGDAPWSCDARVLGRFRDARPLVATLEGGNYVPGIVAEKLTAEGLVVDAGIQAHGERVQVDLTDATGKDARVRGRMVMVSDEMRASYLVQTDLIDVGVSLVRGETQVQLLAGESWLERERTFLGGFRGGARAPKKGAETIR